MEHDSAAAAVLQLLSNRSLPEVGQLPVLLGAVSMMERQELPPLFGVEDTQQLLTHLQVKSFLSMGQGTCLKSASSQSEPLSDMFRVWLDLNSATAIHLVRIPYASTCVQYRAYTTAEDVDEDPDVRLSERTASEDIL